MSQTIAENLRRIMDAHHIDAVELSERLGYQDRAMVDHWLAGRRAVSHRNLGRLAEALGVQVGEIDPAETAYTPSKRKARAAEKKLLADGSSPVTNNAPSSQPTHVVAPPQPAVGVAMGHAMGPGDQALFNQIYGVWLLCRSDEERHALVNHVRSFVEQPETARKKAVRR